MLSLIAPRAHAAVLWPLAPSSLILDVARAGATLVAVGERGFVLRSLDDGQTWTQQPSPVDVMLTALVFLDGRRGIAVGHDETIIVTEDSGVTWSVARQAPESETPLFDVHFTDQARGHAVGAFGRLLSTSDGGATWAEGRVSAEEPHLYALASRGQVLWTAGEAGALLMSVDNGATWAQAPSSPYAGSFFGLMALADGGLLLFGLRGHLFRSDDGGKSWVAITTGTDATLQGGIELASGEVVLAGLGGTVLSSADGRAFAVATLPGREGLSGAVSTSEGRTLVFGEGGVRPWATAS